MHKTDISLIQTEEGTLQESHAILQGVNFSVSKRHKYDTDRPLRNGKGLFLFKQIFKVKNDLVIIFKSLSYFNLTRFPYPYYLIKNTIWLVKNIYKDII